MLRRLCNFFLPYLVASATIHESIDREITQHHVIVEVDSAGNSPKRQLLRKEHRSEGVFAASLAEARLRSRYLPQYPTGPATCDGSKLACPSDASVDPCSSLQNCSAGGYHGCSGDTFKICLPNKENPAKCESGADCLLRCTGVFAEERGDGSKGLPKCTDLAADKCNGFYVADPDYQNNGLGYECGLNDDRTCGRRSTCGVQNPPESLGEKQCRAPDVYKGGGNGTCKTVMTRPGAECITQCLQGFSPSVAKLMCQEGGTFEPKSFSCTANPCTVKSVENALLSGCKEGPESGVAVIESGLTCTVQCQEGFYKSDDVLRCYAETLTPPSFTCEAPCPVPNVENAPGTGVCKEGGDKILPFTSCTTQCAAGYTPSVASMSCRDAVFSPASVACTPDPCSAPTGVEFAHKKGPCQEGDVITSGTSCTAACAAGYTPSVASLACDAATLSPATFLCIPNPCVIPQIEFSAGNGCSGIRGAKVESGKDCRAACKPGYSPTKKKLSCYAETLTPSTFECLPDPCPVPFAKNQEGSGCIGVPGRVDGTVIESTDTCRTECKEGYHVSVESLSCLTGTLTPASFSCIEDSCPAVGGIANAPKVTCKEGGTIESQKTCTTKCKAGYMPNYASLSCKLGKFFPHTYKCEPIGCPLPLVNNRLGSGCSGLPHPAVVNSGASCAAQCLAGYTPSSTELKCFAGTMTPATFTCSENPCDVPTGIQNGASDSCKEGKTIQSGGTCTTQCADGFAPSVAALSCSLGKMSPRTFSCVPDPCVLPQVTDRQGNGCKGKRGTSIASGTTCYPECKAGFSPSESSLKCTAATLTPSTFKCNPNACALPSVNKAQGNGCSGVSGGMIDSGSKCQAACQSGYTASVGSLSCYASVLTPETFTCRPKGCSLPTVQFQAGNGCQGVTGSSISSGTTCQTECSSGYTPDVALLSCFAEVLTPSTFSCVPTPCNLPTVANAQGNGCKGKVGTVIASGAVCKTTCMPGFQTSVAKLDCSAGVLSPASFSCDELKCPAPTGLANAPNVGCAEGGSIAGGRSCTPRCNTGYTPSVSSLACKQGVFEPSSYACVPNSCSIPSISNVGNPKCDQGNTIQHGQKCSPKCKTNYVPSESQLTCMAGVLSPTTFSCKAPCAAPNVANANQPCKEGNLIQHGGSCTSQCNDGYSATSGSLECNNGNLNGNVVCQMESPAVGSSFYNCWSGDPHFTCRNSRRSDPLVPGTHWVLKQSCPNSPNFMWIQGLYGPVSPSGAMGVAFGGMFLGKNVLTIRVGNNPQWIVKWNGQNIQNAWTAHSHRRRTKYKYSLSGTQLQVFWSSSKLEASLSYGVTFKSNRHSWNRQNIKVSGHYYTDYYTSNNLWSDLCRSGSFGGEGYDLPHPRHVWSPSGDDRMVSLQYDMFQQSRASIEQKLNSLTSLASLFAADEVAEANYSMVAEPKLCEGKALEEAQKSCAVLKQEETEEEKEELEEDEEAKDQQEATYQACLADACMTAEKNFGDAGKETEEESEMQSALKHKKEFRIVGADADCKEGWTATDPNENMLSDEEKPRALAKKNGCTVACKICRPKHRRYLVGPMVLHNETRAACVNQRLAMPKNAEDVARLWAIQKEHCTADKAWVGAKYSDGSWKWDDAATLTLAATGEEGDYLCIDKDDGNLVNCEHSASDKNDVLCEGVWY